MTNNDTIIPMAFQAHLEADDIFNFVNGMRKEAKKAKSHRGAFLAVLAIMFLLGGIAGLFILENGQAWSMFLVAVLSLWGATHSFFDDRKFIYTEFLRSQYNILIAANRNSTEFKSAVILFEEVNRQNVYLGKWTEKAINRLEGK